MSIINHHLKMASKNLVNLEIRITEMCYYNIELPFSEKKNQNTCNVFQILLLVNWNRSDFEKSKPYRSYLENEVRTHMYQYHVQGGTWNEISSVSKPNLIVKEYIDVPHVTACAYLDMMDFKVYGPYILKRWDINY